MSNSVATSPFAQRLASFEAARTNLETPRATHADAAKAQLEQASLRGKDAGSYYTDSGQTAFYGMRQAGLSAVVGAAGAAQAGAAAGFAAVGGVAQGAQVVSKGILGAFARGFLALSNALAGTLGEKAAVREAAPAPTAPSFAERMFAKARASMTSAKARLGASGAGFADAAKVGVVGTAANATLGTVSAARATTRLASVGWHSMIAAAFHGAQTLLDAGRGVVTTAETSAQRAREATLRVAQASATAAGQQIVTA